MTKKQIQQELKKVINETQKRPKLCEKLKDKKISQRPPLRCRRSE